MTLALGKYTSHGVTLIGAKSPNGVTFAFTERAGGVSEGAYASLNLGDACGDDAACVEMNRTRALRAIGAAEYRAALINPKQVHGSDLVVVRSQDDARQAQVEAKKGADGIVCTCQRVPVLICTADCVPVVLVAEGGFAVVHSGWRGTLAGISAKAARRLAAELNIDASQITAYLGPHIREANYEVSPELIASFADVFGNTVSADGIHLNLAAAIAHSLAQEGVKDCVDACPDVSTYTNSGRFFSYRAQHGICGRTGAFAVMGADDVLWEVK